MIDIKLIRENPELVKENIRKKFQDEKLVLVDEVKNTAPYVPWQMNCAARGTPSRNRSVL